MKECTGSLGARMFTESCTGNSWKRILRRIASRFAKKRLQSIKSELALDIEQVTGSRSWQHLHRSFYPTPRDHWGRDRGGVDIAQAIEHSMGDHGVCGDILSYEKSCLPHLQRDNFHDK